jgi:hypothetical protein
MPSASNQSTTSGMCARSRFRERAEKACGCWNCGTFRRSHVTNASIPVVGVRSDVTLDDRHRPASSGKGDARRQPGDIPPEDCDMRSHSSPLRRPNGGPLFEPSQLATDLNARRPRFRWPTRRRSDRRMVQQIEGWSTHRAGGTGTVAAAEREEMIGR